jgi:hypothetical protein
MTRTSVPNPLTRNETPRLPPHLGPHDRYIGDAKHGRLVGTDSLGNKYFENYNPYEEVPGTSELWESEVDIWTAGSDARHRIASDRILLVDLCFRSSTMDRLQSGQSDTTHLFVILLFRKDW